MDSRIRRCPSTIFEVFAEISLKDDNSTQLSWLFPEANKIDETTLQNIKLFSFPSKNNGKSASVVYFTFVLTDIDGLFKFGFCRQLPSTGLCTCIVSWLPWFDIFYKLLDALAELCLRDNVSGLEHALHALYCLPVPAAGHAVTVPFIGSNQSFTFVVPLAKHLPCIPDDRNLTEYYNAIDVMNMITLYASMLHERRIIVSSSRLGRLTSCIHASSSFLYPMFWQHLFIPVLPASLLDYCTAPMPYIIGIHDSLLQDCHVEELEDVVIADVDKNVVRSPFSDVVNLPDEVIGILQTELNLNSSGQNPNHVLGDKLSRAFLRSNIALIGGYRDALKFHSGSPITFDSEAFLRSRPVTMRPFLEKMLQLQLFMQFITERLALLNSGKGFTDEFENESTMLASQKFGSKLQYSDWLNEMKKIGRKFRQEGGKDRWSFVANKVLVKGKKAYKGIRQKLEDYQHTIKLEDLNKDDIQSSLVRNKQTRTTLPPRPPRPSHLAITRQMTVPQRSSAKRSPSSERSQRAAMISIAATSSSCATPLSRRGSKRVSADDSDLDVKFVGLDLSTDPDIQRVMKAHSLESLIIANSEDSPDTSSNEKRDILEQDKFHSRQSSEHLQSLHSSSSTLHSDTVADMLISDFKAMISLNSSEASCDSQDMLSPSNMQIELAMSNTQTPLADLGIGIKTSTPSDSESQRASLLSEEDGGESGNKGLLRHKAFYKTQRPMSVVKRSAVFMEGGANLREARAMFMQSEVMRPAQFNDQPANAINLNRIALDKSSPIDDPAGRIARREEENSILKSWNLNRPQSSSSHHKTSPVLEINEPARRLHPQLPLSPNVSAMSNNRCATLPILQSHTSIQTTLSSAPSTTQSSAPPIPPRPTSAAKQWWMQDGSSRYVHQPNDAYSHLNDLRHVSSDSCTVKDHSTGNSKFLLNDGSVGKVLGESSNGLVESSQIIRSNNVTKDERSSSGVLLRNRNTRINLS